MRQSCQLPVADCQFESVRRSRARATDNRSRASAFTLTEILIVIALIVLIIAIAVPALDLITGGRSIAGAENQISAYLGRARAEAIGIQEYRGVAFFVDPATERMTMAIVQYTPIATDPSDAIDLEPDTEQLPLPPGVGLHLIGDNTGAALYPYIEYGVIMFDAYGRVVSRDFEIQGTSNLGIQAPAIATAAPNVSELGFVLYDRQQFVTASQLTPPLPNVQDWDGNGTVDMADWLSQNGLPILVNRYNGTLVEGE
jgi:type II secretory pathway pseudopilin PulG